MRNALVALAMLTACGPPVSREGPAPLPKTKAPAEPTHPANPTSVRHPELVQRLNDYAFDDDKPGEVETNVVDALKKLEAARAAAPLVDVERDAIFKLFLRTRVSLEKARHRGMFRVLNRLVTAIADPSWEDQLIGLIDKPIPSARKEHLNELMDQVYWQITASETLGNARSEKAVAPLMKVVMSPLKGNVATTAMASLAKIGPPVVALATKLLGDKQPALAAYAESELLRAMRDQGTNINARARAEAKYAYVDIGYAILGNVGTNEAAKRVDLALSSSDKLTRQVAAMQLGKLPKTPERVTALKSVYLKTSPTDQLPAGDYVKESLLSSAIALYEQGMVGWVVDDALKLKGKDSDVLGVQAAVLSFAMRTATKAEWPKVEAIFVKVGTSAKKNAVTDEQKADWARYEKARAAAKAMLDQCGSKGSCYLKELSQPADHAMTWIKSATMAMIYGKDSFRSEAVRLVLQHNSPDVRGIAGQALLAFAPHGAASASETLEAEIQKATASGDPKRLARVKPVKQLTAVLRAREREHR